MRFRASQRLRWSRDFDAVRQSKLRADVGHFIVQIRLREDTGLRRLGVIASRRVGNAVLRNRCKRRLRELFRLHQELLPTSCDTVLVARRSLPTAPWDELVQRYQKAMRRLAPESGLTVSETAET